MNKIFEAYKENYIVPQAKAKCIHLIKDQELYEKAVQNEVKRIIYIQYLLPLIVIVIFATNSLFYYL
ncbi:hypothetical protein CW670_10995 [Macrococcoides caseolyticum]|uniref:hypothetical protein n=1 Tax=Macrococcoides caseolyticum TaxID=69966 RepID=UPI000C34AD9E|nr:hypothetical protein [Macrococcus caseolyticus]PKE73657.1 hypothetical protein CW670_10995 [Macrococcus caseolyticus]